MTGAQRGGAEAPGAMPQAALAAVTALAERIEGLLAGPVVPGSAASTALGVQHGEHASRLGLRMLRTAVDHLLAWRAVTLLAERGLAGVTLLRVAQQNAYAVLWLLEPGLSLHERVRRGVIAQLAEHDGERLLEQAMGVDPAAFPEPWQTAADAYEDLLAYAVTIGAARPGPVRAQPEPVPAPADLYARYGASAAKGGRGQEWVYRIGAGAEAGMGWATWYAMRMAAGADEAGGHRDGLPGTVELPPGPGPDLIPLFTALAVEAVGRAVEAAVDYHPGTGS
jgi:hypothetical protein